MKKENLMKSLIVGIFILVNMVVANALTVQFKTTGNCAICEIRIEGAVSQIPGVDSVRWDMATDVTTVTYDETKLDCHTIMHVIANVGHDTEWFRAPDSAYALLIGSCCEYERVINYDSVQVGYLSLMGIWSFPLGISKPNHGSLVAYPTIGNGIYQLKNANLMSAPVQIIIYAMNGLKVKELTFYGEQTTLDLQSYPAGEYICIVTERERKTAQLRLIKVN